jgi:membrane fusion protein (multidrug efflux system)
VDGVIQKIIYQPRIPIKVGDPLFELDNASYAAAVAADEADVAAAEANLPVAQSAYDRAAKLEGSGFTLAQVETARSTLASAQATLSAAEAALEYSKVQLGWTTIRSPIDGVAESPSFSVGDLVTNSQSDALTTITNLNPIDVDMLETSARILDVRRQTESGTLKINERIAASLVLENGQTYQTTGTLVAPANTVSTTTGTVTVRFVFDNPEGRILPGMFVRGQVELGTVNAFLVPQRAGSRVADGQLSALVVGDDYAATLVRFKDAGNWNNNWIVTEGLDEGMQVIVDGLKSVKAGSQVVPTLSVIDEDGLVQDAPAAAGN